VFELAIGREAVGELREVDERGVELRAVDAGVARHAVHGDPAASAHSGPVDHDRVERHGRRNAERRGDGGDGPHHRHGPDRVDRVHATGGQRVRQCLGDEARPAVAAVVGAGDDRAGRRQLSFEDDPLAGAASDDARDGDAPPLELLGDRQDHRRAHTAADAYGMARLDQIGRPPQRTGDVRDCLSWFELDEVGGALADGLDHERDRACRRIAVADRQRDPLGALRPPDDDELAGLPDRGDPGRVDDEAGHVGRELVPGDDRMHGTTFRLCLDAR
jgi:hypothetical protein